MKSETAGIQRVFDAYEPELVRVEETLRSMFESEVFLIPAIGHYILKSGGKRMRPLFLLASAALAGYKGEEHIRLAGVIESIHTASLLHDDVVDGAESRRGNPSANSLWSNQVVILVGDYLYSNALRLTIGHRDHRVNEAFSSATTRMTQGELIQLQNSRNVDISEEEYFEIVSAKTGALISAASRVGGILGGCGPDEEKALAEFGMKAGIAFQVADDILDYMADTEELGKKLGKDLEEGKVTLPMICLLRNVTAGEKEDIRSVLDADGITESGLARILDLFGRYNAIEQAMRRATTLVQEAKDALGIFPPSEARQHMFVMADYALQRDR